MPINIDSEVWEALCEVMRPTVESDGLIESIRFSSYSPKLKLTVDSPRPSFESGNQNESLTVHDSISKQIAVDINTWLSESVSETSQFCNTEFRTGVITESGILPFFDVTVLLPERTHLYESLPKTLVDLGYINECTEFAYGIIDTCHYDSIDDGWRVDGTLYKYTDEPYTYWSRGSNDNYPENMDEWVDFAGETDAEKRQIRNKDRHLIHFHPTEINVDEENSLVKWFNDSEDAIKSHVSLTNTGNTLFELREISVTPTQTTLRASLSPMYDQSE